MNRIPRRARRRSLCFARSSEIARQNYHFKCISDVAWRGKVVATSLCRCLRRAIQER